MTGRPLIPHSRPTLEERDLAAVAAVLQSGQVAQGPRVAAFETAVAGFLGTAGGVAVSSGTAALEVALRALGIGRGDEVLVPSYVCAAPWIAVARTGAVPRVVDVTPDTYTLAPAAAAAAQSAKTKAAIVVHAFGASADLRALGSLGIPLIEDCAQAIGATAGGRQVGSVGRLSICSFYATKLLCTGEGGMVLSQDTHLLEACRTIREYDEKPMASASSFNYKLTDMQAALGVSQLERLAGFLTRRAAIAALYGKALAETGAGLPVVPEGCRHAFFRYVVRLKPDAPALAQGVDGLLRRLEGQGIQCRRPVFQPLHRMLGQAGCPNAEAVHETAISIPIYPSLSDADVTRVAEAVHRELAR